VLAIAPLTGADIIALGNVATGLMTNNDDVASRILKASQESEDKVWRLPLDETYQDALESPIADMINASFDRSAGSITAGCFLSRFTVPLLVQLLRDLAHAN
jgi:leucyl aminopeptidase